MARELKLNLPPADDLFTTQEERDDAKREKVLEICVPIFRNQTSVVKGVNHN
jgi:hypothetical protein